MTWMNLVLTGLVVLLLFLTYRFFQKELTRVAKEKNDLLKELTKAIAFERAVADGKAFQMAEATTRKKDPRSEAADDLLNKAIASGVIPKEDSKKIRTTPLSESFVGM